MTGKVLSDALIRRLNEACEELLGKGECREECAHIGWCDGCWQREGERRMERDKRREQGVHDDTVRDR